jgi:hypothetical protein
VKNGFTRDRSISFSRYAIHFQNEEAGLIATNSCGKGNRGILFRYNFLHVVEYLRRNIGNVLYLRAYIQTGACTWGRILLHILVVDPFKKGCFNILFKLQH